MNGELIEEILQVSHKHNSIIVNDEEEILAKNIKSIVTKEQFKSIEYEV